MLRLREAYRSIELYDPKRTPCAVDLSDNTNLFGVAPSVRELLRDLPTKLVTRYPSVFADELKRALAQRHGVEPANITTGCGSDDVIDNTMRAFCEPGDRVAYPVPTFGVVQTFTRMNAAVPVEVDDAGALPAAHAAVNYLCTPNNPTGQAASRQRIEQLENELSGVLLLDEAYADFGDADYGRFAAASQRTVSLRTMSKACGLAGLRVGYAIGPMQLIHEIEKSRGPYKVNAIAEAAACTILSTDMAWVAEVVAQTREIRARLAARLDALHISFWPSSANFILIQLPPGRTAAEVKTALRARGVAIRPFTELRGHGECIRITVGPWPMMEVFLHALPEVI